MPHKKPEPRELQAVVLCDTYQTRFWPLTKDRPRCLLPLANTPLLEYTLEFLVIAQVSEVYLIARSHAGQVAEYIRQSKWASTYSPFVVHVIELPNSLSVGDAMRDIDARGVIKSDFLLISGDVVCSVDFEKVWEAHTERRKEDHNCIMSIVLRKASATHRTRSAHTGLFVIDAATGRMVSYGKTLHSKGSEVEASELLKLPEVEFRNDLIDCRIDICTVDVPALFTENFDYESLRDDFVNGILTSDLLGKTIYGHILDEGYAARVESFKTYRAVTEDIVSRYSYPLVVDLNELAGQTYSHRMGHVYLEKDVVLSHSCIIGRGTVIGGDSFVGPGAEITDSIIGRGCRIGKGALIKDSYIWENCQVGENAQVISSIVANGVVLGSGAKVCETVVPFHSEIGPNTEANPPENYGEDSDDSLPDLLEHLDMSDSSIEEDEKPAKQHKRRSLSTTSVASGASDNDEDFFKEAVASINRSIVDKHTQDVAALELNTLRMTMNSQHEWVQMAVVHALLEHVSHLAAEVTTAKKVSEQIFTEWSPVLKRITFDFPAQVALAGYIEKECAGRRLGDALLFFVVSTIYDTDVLSEEAIYNWWAQPAILAGERKVIKPWIEWLQTAEEESD